MGPQFQSGGSKSKIIRHTLQPLLSIATSRRQLHRYNHHHPQIVRKQHWRPHRTPGAQIHATTLLQHRFPSKQVAPGVTSQHTSPRTTKTWLQEHAETSSERVMRISILNCERHTRISKAESKPPYMNGRVEAVSRSLRTKMICRNCRE